ncbi:MAG: hypothetical protein KBC73_13175 [Burkholderiaceae bacterium]|nr:hypothetical protein [Burkholderiaceae bacterium]
MSILPPLPTTGALSPSVTPAELLLLCGVIAEQAHRLGVSTITSCVARRTTDEWIRLAKSRGFSDERQMRAAFRVGRITPRGLKLSAQVVSHFTVDEVPVLVDRARRFEAFMARPSLATGAAVQQSPQLPLARPFSTVSGVR